MDDALVVRRLERLGNLARDAHAVVEREPARDPLGERLAFDQLHHQEMDGRSRAGWRGLLEAVQRRDARMIERGERSGFALEPGEPIVIAEEHLEHQLQGDLAPEPGVARAKHFAHPAGAERGDDLVLAEPCSGTDRHGSGWWAG